MRIFTLGKNGIPLFLFAFILFSGTYSYGQNCPTVDETSQVFCYPSTVADLEATENGETVRWYRSSDSTTPIPMNELLQSDTYYAGNASASCTSRVAVEVTVEELPAPVSLTGNFWQACLYGETDDDIQTVANLIDLMRTTEDDYVIEVFATGTDEDALDETDVLTAGSTYYVAQSDPTGCSSPRLPINYDTVLTTVPTGEDEQIFCNTDGATPTIADLEASGTNRWYSTSTSNPALDPSTPLIHGETYYASRIVNRDDSDEPPCESIDRFAVTVFLDVVFENTTQTFCESIGTGNDGGPPTVADLEPLNSPWFSDPQLSNSLAPDTQLVDGTTYYLVDADEDCRSTSVTVSLDDAPNAGSSTSIDVCTNEEPFDLAARMNPSGLGEADAGGIFSPALASGTTMFDPAVDAARQYTYTVGADSECPDDSAFITVNFVDPPNVGEPVDETICLSELDNPLVLAAEFEAYLEGREEGGTFTVGEEEELTFEQLLDRFAMQIQDQQSFIGTYTAIYTVEESIGGNSVCSSSVEISLTVAEDPIAGDNGTIQLVEDSDNTLSLEDALEGDPDTVGTWTNEDGATVDGTFVPQEPGVYTYTVTNEGCSATATVTVLPVPLDCPEVTQTEYEFCASIGEGDDYDRPRISDLGPPEATWYATADTDEALDSDTILEDGIYYAGNAAGDCENRTAVTVNILPTPNAGGTTTVTFCENEAAVNLVDFIEDSQLGAPQQTGTFSPALENNMFDPAEWGPGTHAFTYNIPGTENCNPDLSRTTVTVLPTPDAGDGGEIQLVEGTPNTVSLSDANAGTPVDGGIWTNEDDETVSGDFEPQTPGVYTYTLETGNECSATATVTVLPAVPQECPELMDIDETICSSAVLSVGPMIDQFLSYFEGIELSDLANARFDLNNTEETENYQLSQVYYVVLTQYEDGVRDFSFTYTLETENCSDSAQFDVTVLESPDMGPEVDESFCISSGDDLPTVEELRAFYSLEGRPEGGTFETPVDDLIAAFNENPFGTFATVYTVTEGECTESVTLSVTINEEVEANAGGDVTAEVCSTAGVQDLEDFLGEDAVLGGNFSAPYEDGTFDPSTAGTDPVVITYTLTEEEHCVIGESSATITLTVIDGPDAGNDGSITLNVTDAPVNLFDSLEGTPEEGGTWTPGNEDGALDPSEYTEGVYEFTYTVTSENGCDATATVEVTIVGEVTCPEVTETAQAFCESIGEGNDFRLPTVSDLSPAGATWYATADTDEALPADTVLENGATYFAGNSNGTCDARDMVTVTLDDSPNAGATTSVSFCEGDYEIDLLEEMNESILGAPDEGGTFSPALASGGTIFNPALDAAGTYTYRVESTNDVCEADTAVINISITPLANAGVDTEVTFCATQAPQGLTEFLDGGQTTGSFEGLENNIFDPSEYEVGSYEFEYTVSVEGDCESESTSTMTVTVTEAPAAPEATDLTFCAVDNATVANLTATGESLQWYTDEALTEPADETAALVNGAYYVTQSTEGGCESPATMITVTVTDAEAPSMSPGGNVFCDYDRPTLADLEANLNESGTVTWYSNATDGSSLSSSELLQNGTTYYAALTDATSACESSERLPVTVTLESCEVLIPDAFSPNGDGINDRFEIEHLGAEYPNYTIEIYNRWGNLVFTGNSSTPNWDGVSTEGSLGDDVLPVGVYFYIVNFNDGQTAPTQGRLYLSR